MNTPQTLFDSVWHEKLEAGAPSHYVVGDNLRVDAAAAMLKPAHRLLDAGCGTGMVAVAVRHKFEEIYGVDVAEQAVNAARQNGMIARRVDLNVECLPFADAFFDAVLLLAVLPYIYDPDHLLKECHRVLRPGGTLFVGTANIRTVAKLFKIIVRGRFPTTSKAIRAGYDGGAMHYFCSSDLHALLVGSGFLVLKTSGFYYRPRFLESTLARLPLIGAGVREFFAGEVLVEAERPSTPLGLKACL